MWYWCAKEAANCSLFQRRGLEEKIYYSIKKINKYEIKYWLDIVVLSDISRINKLEVLEYSLKMWIKLKVKIMCKNKERICAFLKFITLKKYHLSTQIEFIGESLCQQQQMWTIY